MKRRRCMVMAIRNAIRNRDPSRGGFDGWFTEEGRSLSDAEVLDRMLDAMARVRPGDGRSFAEAAASSIGARR